MKKYITILAFLVLTGCGGYYAPAKVWVCTNQQNLTVQDVVPQDNLEDRKGKTVPAIQSVCLEYKEAEIQDNGSYPYRYNVKVK